MSKTLPMSPVIQLQNAPAPCQVHLRPGPHSSPPYTCMAVSPDHNIPFLATGSKTGVVTVWNYRTGALLKAYQPDTTPIHAIDMSHTGLQITTGGRSDRWAWTRISEDLSPIGRVVETPQPNIRDIAWSADDKLIATSSRDGSVFLWDTRSAAARHCLRVPEADVKIIMFSPDSTRIVASYAPAGNTSGALVILWDTATGQSVRTLAGHTQCVVAVAFAPDGRIATGSRDGTCKIWSAEGSEIHTLHARGRERKWVGSVAFSPDGNDIAIGWSDAKLDIRDSRTAARRHEWNYTARPVNSIAYSRTGRYVAVGYDFGTTAVWDTTTGDQLLAVIDTTNGNIEKVVFSPDEEHLIEKSVLGWVRVWHLLSIREEQLKWHAQDMAAAGLSTVAHQSGFGQVKLEPES